MAGNHHGDRLGRTARHHRSAFTLVELLVAIGVIAALMGVLLPAVSMALSTARGFRCQMSMRAVAFDFQIFADEMLHGDRGDDHRTRDFRLETFQESQYGVDEFWRWGDDLVQMELPDAVGNNPMRCPSVGTSLVLRRNLACGSGAVGPPQSVSYGFNMRLDRAEVIDASGRPRAVPVRLLPGIVQHADVPLLIDVDGQLAFERGSQPIFTAPTLDSQGLYADDRFWYAARRHAGRANAAFLDGHVGSSSDPANEPGWRWDFQPVR